MILKRSSKLNILNSEKVGTKNLDLKKDNLNHNFSYDGNSITRNLVTEFSIIIKFKYF